MPSVRLLRLLSAVDERSAEWFGWTTATAKRHRLNLVKTGWLLIDKGKLTGNKIYVYYLGKKSVAEAREMKP